MQKLQVCCQTHMPRAALSQNVQPRHDQCPSPCKAGSHAPVSETSWCYWRFAHTRIRRSKPSLARMRWSWTGGCEQLRNETKRGSHHEGYSASAPSPRERGTQNRRYDGDELLVGIIQDTTGNSPGVSFCHQFEGCLIKERGPTVDSRALLASSVLRFLAAPFCPSLICRRPRASFPS